MTDYSGESGDSNSSFGILFLIIVVLAIVSFFAIVLFLVYGDNIFSKIEIIPSQSELEIVENSISYKEDKLILDVQRNSTENDISKIVFTIENSTDSHRYEIEDSFDNIFVKKFEIDLNGFISTGVSGVWAVIQVGVIF